MAHLKIEGIGNPRAFEKTLNESPLMQGLAYGASSAPGKGEPIRIEDRAPGEIDRRVFSLTVDTDQVATKNQIETLLTGAGLTVQTSQMAEGKFPAGAFYDASDDDD